MQFFKAKRGAFAIQFALMVIPLVVCTGLAIDGGRVFLARFALSSSLDAAALAIGSTATDDQVEMKQIATNYVDRNFRVAGTSNLELDVVPGADQIFVWGEVDIDTFFMPVVGTEAVRIRAESTVRKASSGLLVSLVLDNTGSMWASNNIESLRDAAEILADDLFDGETMHDYLRMSIVPYSSMVNPGAEAVSIVNVHPHDEFDPSNKEKWKGCVFERTGTNSLADTPPTTAKWDIMWHEPASDNNWTYGDPSTIKVGGASNTNSVRGPNNGCPTPITPLTNDKSVIDAAIADMSAYNRGGTMTDIGMAWGLRTLSPGAPFTQTAESDPYSSQTYWQSPTWRKAMVIMTDGESQFYGISWPDGANSSHPSASDVTGYDRLDSARAQAIFTTTNNNTAKSQLNDRVAALCTTIKNTGITVYVVTFTSGISSSVRQIYEDCATDSGKYWYAPSGTALEDAFEQIGEDLSRLRLAQ